MVLVCLTISDELYGHNAILSSTGSENGISKYGFFNHPQLSTPVALRIRTMTISSVSKAVLKISRQTAELFDITDVQEVDLKFLEPSLVISCAKKCSIVYRRNRANDILAEWTKICLHGLFFKNQDINMYYDISLICETSIAFVNDDLPVEHVSSLEAKISEFPEDLDSIGSMTRTSDFVSVSALVDKLHKISARNENPPNVLDDADFFIRKNLSRSVLETHSITSIFNDQKPISSYVSQTEADDRSSWDKIGGYSNILSQVKFHLNSLSENSGRFEEIGVKPPKGILLYGPPGCSKTMIARTIAQSRSCRFFSVKGAEIFKKWVGDSEKAIKKIFDEARSQSPSVIFFDEFDAIASARSDSGSVENRVIGQILSEMDGLNLNSRVLIIAATNRPEILDPAILRAGRFDIHINVPLPSEVDRKDILIKEFSKSKISADILDFEYLASHLNGYSGAEIVNLCKKAIAKAIKKESLTTEVILDLAKAVGPRLLESAGFSEAIKPK